MKRLLTIAGSDSGGGAGVQQDLKVFTVLGSYGLSVITALTAQNTLGVHGIYDVTPDFVKKQLDCVMTDIKPHAIKTGMLSNSEIIKAVSEVLENYKETPLIVDPVMVAKGGSPLLRQDAIDALKNHLLPLADIITPNIPEAEVLLDEKITDLESMKNAAKKLIKLLKKSKITAVVLKGGHLEGDTCYDVITTLDTVVTLEGKRINKKNTHGTGCTFSACLTHYISIGLDPIKASKQAKDFTTKAIKFATDIGHGIGPTNPYANLGYLTQKYQVLECLKFALSMLQTRRAGEIIPEVQSNLGYALQDATDSCDIAAFPGRIIRFGSYIKTFSEPEYGASINIAKVILSVMKYYPNQRAAMNIKFSDIYLSRANDLGYKSIFLDRSSQQPSQLINDEILYDQAIKAYKESNELPPDIIYDYGSHGKEALIRVIGEDPIEVVIKALNITGI